MKKRLLALGLSLGLILACAGCGGGDGAGDAPQGEPQADAPKAAEKLLLGVSLQNTGDVFDRILYEGMMAYGEEHKDEIDLQILNAQGDVNTQLTNVDQLINSKVKALVLWPRDVDALTPAVEAANAAGIPVVCVNTRTNGGAYTYVGSNDEEAGRIQGEWLAEKLPENAKYCYLMGPIGHSGQIGRKKGMQAVLAEKRPDIELLAEQTAEWDRAKAMNITDDWLKSFPEVTAIVSQNDNMALGAIEAVRTADKLDSILVTGTDATEEACASIKAGDLAMSVYQNAHDQGYFSADVALKLARGEWTKGDMDIPFEAVDAENVDQYIAQYEAAE